MPVPQIKQALAALGLEGTKVVPGRLPGNRVRLTITAIFSPDRSQPVAQEPRPEPEPTTTLPVTPPPQVHVDLTIIPGVGPQVAAALHAAGLHTLDRLRDAPDEVLLAVHNVTRSTVSKIRAWFN